MQKAKLIIPLLLVSLLACTPQQEGPNPAKFNKGTEGINIEFVENSPPNKVYEDTSFPMMVQIHNRGAKDIPFTTEIDGETVESQPASISMNFDNFYIDYAGDLTREEVQSSLQNLKIRGKSEIVPNGEVRNVKLGNLQAQKIVGNRESPETQLYASICYPYETKLSTDLCMDANTQSENVREQVCQATDLAFSRGQGAPVSITKVEVDMVPLGSMTRPSLTIHIENTGPGNVLKSLTGESDLEEACALQSEPSNLNTINVEADIAGVELECEPDPVRLAGQKNSFHCIVPEEDLETDRNLFSRQDNFVTTLNIQLLYYYTNSVSKKIEIQRRSSNEFPPQQEESQCQAWETEQSGGVCTNKCGQDSETAGYTCSCNREECIDELEDSGRCNLQNLCPPGSYCCKKTACDDFDGDATSCRQDGKCSYCEATDECVRGTCDQCEYEAVKQDGVCVENEEG